MSEQVPPSSDRLRRMASDYEEAVSAARAEQIAARAITRARREVVHRRRLAVVAVCAGLALMVGLGLTSAGSLPGDSLYTVSRAYEEIGERVGLVDPVEQRLNEVIALANRGDTVLAAKAAEAALVELGYGDGYTPSLLPTTTTTAPDSEDRAPATGTTPTTAPPPITVDADAQSGDEQTQSLRLAAELLLSNVKDNGGDLEAAAAELAKAVSDIATDDIDVVTTTSTTVPPSTSTTTTVPSTSTTVAEDDGSTTTTTIPDASTTTVPDGPTTTVPEDDGDDGKGPIFLPPGF